MSASPKNEATPRPSRQSWQTPELRQVGTVGEILQGGDNKVTVVTGDPGEPRKVPGMDK